MPELPEVETTKRGIAPHVEGQTIASLRVHNPNLRWPVPGELAELANGAVIGQLQRRAKYLLMPVGTDYVLLWHLGMSGSLRIVTPATPLRKHDHIELELANGTLLRYHDPRRFGALLYAKQGETNKHVLLEHLGPEPLSDAFNVAHMITRAANKKQPIKTFIMDNANVVGVGNIYACESLFKAGIHPNTPAGRVSQQRWIKLVEAIKTTLAAAIEQGGTTLRDFVGGDGEPGYFAQQLFVYGRNGEPCRVCETPVKLLKMSGRATCYCGKCQRY
ncbi:bifunctional DNA-formamidopyrimidine glycosylase/DNA-(apurinic or apyrimidinic site) lyase [Salinibius halmophilus]|uniref:bifunctional DNA-formamidopyrimidine glycosylase/DNA-(apurinic or apyrimidinic site) lyase n=1 Tax=Salinibius halmophilus TaxID=1853216 RepID=UPI000E66C66B|nr:bifunctional DNA-formamidopyrimidine glycosylase/DNA-(apurinic or apyrimidinic site) lyase [Salinibius halmophilus]